MQNVNNVEKCTHTRTPSKDTAPKRAGIKQPSKKKDTKQTRLLKERYTLANHRHFRGRCFVCGRPYKPRAYFVFHHLWYEKDEKIYSDFTSDNAYTAYVMTRIKQNPARFLLLCRGHHKSVEMLAKYGDTNRKRLYHAVRATVAGHLKMARRKS